MVSRTVNIMGNDNNCQTFCDSFIPDNPRDKFRMPPPPLSQRSHPTNRYYSLHSESIYSRRSQLHSIHSSNSSEMRFRKITLTCYPSSLSNLAALIKENGFRESEKDKESRPFLTGACIKAIGKQIVFKERVK